MARGRRRPNATKEFKRRAVEMYRNRGNREVKAITAELGITNSQIHRWVQEFPENGRAPKAHALQRDSSSEAAALRREIAQLSEECRVLKMAVQIFVRGQ